MIQFQMFDHQPERCEKYHQMLKDNLPVLELSLIHISEPTRQIH